MTNQIELSPLYLAPLHDGTLDQLQQWRVPPMVWSPVAGGRLFNADDERARRVREALEAVGREVGAPVGGVALAAAAPPGAGATGHGYGQDRAAARAVMAGHRPRPAAVVYHLGGVGGKEVP